MILLNCLLITIFFVIVIDQQHFVDEITEIISGWMTNGKIKKPIPLKPFSCSTCMSFWCNLIYILIVGKFSIFMIGYILLLSWSAPLINSIFTLLKNAIIKFINILAEKIEI